MATLLDGTQLCIIHMLALLKPVYKGEIYTPESHGHASRRHTGVYLSHISATKADLIGGIYLPLIYGSTVVFSISTRVPRIIHNSAFTM